MKNCIFCHKPLPAPTNPQTRNYKLHPECRGKWQYQQRGGKEAQRAYYYKRNEGKHPDSKIQCLICGKWYVQVGSHIVQVHKMTAREYREYMELEVKRGLTKGSFRELKAERAFETDTVKNLKSGKKFWFKPGDKRAGRYQRSPITLERLKKLHTLKGGEKNE